MSYGKTPANIYSNGEKVFFYYDQDGKEVDACVPVVVLAQFVARMIARGEDEVEDWIRLGVELAPEDFTEDFMVLVVGGFKHTSSLAPDPQG